MLKKIKTILNKLLVVVTILSLLSIYMIMIPIISLAADDVVSLSTPTNLRWKDDSTATATWDNVENANHYKVYVYVYKDYNLIGSKETGTDINEINIEDIIVSIVKAEKYAPVQVYFKVKAELISENSLLESQYSSISEEKEMKNGSTVLDTPKEVKLTENYIGSWTAVDNVDYYRIDYKIITSNGTEIIGYADYVYKFDLVETNGIVSTNLTEALRYAYNDALCRMPEKVQISYRVKAIAPYWTDYIDSEYSEYSNSNIYPVRTQLDSPSNVTLSQDYFASWTEIDNADEYELSFKIIYEDFEKTGYTEVLSLYNLFYPEEGKVMINLKDVLNQIYSLAGYSREKVQISFMVRAKSNNYEVYKESEYSLYSNSISFAYNGQNPLDTPTNVTLDDNCIGSWNKVENADFYNIEYKIVYNNFEKIIIDDAIEYFHLNENNGLLTINLNERFKNVYLNAGYINETVKISYRISACVRYYDYENKYIDSLYSEFSNEVEYNPNIDISYFNIEGTITSYNSNSDDIVIRLYRGERNDLFDEKTVRGNTINYEFTDIPPGTYTIKVLKDNHTTREYAIVIDESDIVQDIQICLIGDINGDGKINIKDWNRLYSHINETNSLTGYELLCADINKDEKVNIKDWNRMYDHITEVNPL